MAASSSRSRVTRLELTADQLLGSDLISARSHHKQRKNAPKVITIEDLLGPSLTIAGGPSRSSPAARTRSPSLSLPRPAPTQRTASPRRAPALNPSRERVTADEVLRTGVPLRTLQAAKARARSAQATQTLASGSVSGSSSSIRPSGSREPLNRPRVVTAEELAGPGPSSSSSSRRPRSAGGGTSSANPPSLRANADSTRVARPATAGAASNRANPAAGGANASTTSGPSGTARGRGSARRSSQMQRSNSQGSTRTLPMYTREPGESEVVIDRGAEELEDEIPITVMTPVEEDGSSLANGLASTPSSPVAQAAQGELERLGRHLNPMDAITHMPIPMSPIRTFSPTVLMPYAEEAPSYESAVSMSTPDLLAHAADIPLPASPALSPALSPTLSIPGRSGATSPSSTSRPNSALGSSGPPSPGAGAEGAESPRKRFQFMSLFHHSHGGSSSRSRIRGGSVSGLPSVASPTAPDGGVLSSPPSPRPCHRSSQSASGSMLDLLSRSWSDNPMVRSRSEREGA